MVRRTFRVLVADDEYWICENLRHMIPWQEYGLEFLQPASNGEEVLNRLREEHPDILITDINMPFVSGLELLHRVKEIDQDVVCFVISGYDDFQNVKGAFLEGSINFLLKPVSKTDLIDTLSKAIRLIGERNAEQLKEEKQRTDAQKVASFLQDNEFSNMLRGGGVELVPNLLLPGDMEIGGATMILIKFHRMNQLAEGYHHDMLLMSHSVKNKIRKEAKKEKLLIFNYSYRVNEFILYGEMEHRERMELAEMIKQLFPEEQVGPVSIVIGEHTFLMDDLKEAYQEVVAILMSRPFCPHSMIITAHEEKGRPKLIQELEKKEENELCSVLSRMDMRGIETVIFEHIGLGHCEERGWSLLRTRQTTRKVADLILKTATGVSEEAQLQSLEESAEQADMAVNQLNMEQIRECIWEMLEEIKQSKGEEPSDSMRSSIKKAVVYVDQTFNENYTLGELAARFHVEQTYFSKLFRQETGENLIPYLSKKRMEQAVTLMEESELSLTEISFLVGYEDYRYFSRVFRKYRGCSPKEYRSMKMREKEVAM